MNRSDILSALHYERDKILADLRRIENAIKVVDELQERVVPAASQSTPRQPALPIKPSPVRDKDHRNNMPHGYLAERIIEILLEDTTPEGLSSNEIAKKLRQKFGFTHNIVRLQNRVTQVAKADRRFDITTQPMPRLGGVKYLFRLSNKA